MREKLKNIKAVIWDLDNTLYACTDDFVRDCNGATARTAIAAGHKMDLEEAHKMATESYEKNGSSLLVFVHDFGIPREFLHHQLHLLYRTDMLEKTDGMIEAFEKLHLPSAIITHASRVWANRILDHINLKSFFPNNSIFPLEDYGFERKSKGEKSFKMAAEYLGHDYEDILFVEDSVTNLSIPHKMGFKTALIHYREDFESHPDVDFAYKTTPPLLHDLIAQQDMAAA